MWDRLPLFVMDMWEESKGLKRMFYEIRELWVYAGHWMVFAFFLLLAKKLRGIDYLIYILFHKSVCKSSFLLNCTMLFNIVGSSSRLCLWTWTQVPNHLKLVSLLYGDCFGYWFSCTFLHIIAATLSSTTCSVRLLIITFFKMLLVEPLINWGYFMISIKLSRIKYEKWQKEYLNNKNLETLILVRVFIIFSHFQTSSFEVLLPY